MIKDTLYIGQEAREKLVKGIKKCSDAVGSTMGTGGSNGIIEAIENPGHLLTNDGATILSSIRLSDPIEEMGRRILFEAVSRANKSNGDGSSTTAVLTSAILIEGIKRLGDVSLMEIKRSLEACVPIIEESIKKQTRSVEIGQIGAVAAISAEDEKIGATIQEIYEKIGKEGIIHWDISKTAEDSYTIGQGITVEGAGYYSPYMCDANESGQNTNQIKIKDPTILITAQKITSASEFNELFQALYNKEIKDVVVFCDEVDPLVIPDLIKTRMVKGFRTVLVKMPILWRDWWYEDLAFASGAKIISPTAGLPLKNATLADLGKFDNITITKHDTYIDGIIDPSEKIKTFEAEGTDESKLRASRLNTKTARYFVGAQSDSALSYRRLKVEDAISASWHALNGGVVAGGGIALLNASKYLRQTNNGITVELESAKTTYPDLIGILILEQALKAPFKQIAQNIGVSVDIHLTDASWEEAQSSIDSNMLKDNMGLNTKSKQIEDLFEAHITDPAPIVLNAVKNAISVAAVVLTVNTIVLLPIEEAQTQQFNPMVL